MSLVESYRHYRYFVGCGRLYAAYRALYYETHRRGPREPKKWRSRAGGES